MNNNPPIRKDLQKLPHNFQIMFAVFCAKQVFHLVQEKDKEVCLKAIEVAEGFLEGVISKEQANAAANAANADKEKMIKEQWEYYNELLNFEQNFEEIVLE